MLDHPEETDRVAIERYSARPMSPGEDRLPVWRQWASSTANWITNKLRLGNEWADMRLSGERAKVRKMDAEALEMESRAMKNLAETVEIYERLESKRPKCRNGTPKQYEEALEAFEEKLMAVKYKYGTQISASEPEEEDHPSLQGSASVEVQAKANLTVKPPDVGD